MGSIPNGKSKTSKVSKISKKSVSSKKVPMVLNKKTTIKKNKKIVVKSTDRGNNPHSRETSQTSKRERIGLKPKSIQKGMSKIPSKSNKVKSLEPAIVVSKAKTAKVVIKPQSKKDLEKKDKGVVLKKPEELINENDEYMNPKYRVYFHKILLDWKTQLIEGMKKTIYHMQNDSASFSDPNDKASQEEEFSLELHARVRDQESIRRIDGALERLKNNEYGYCDACGIDIGIKRLKASPTANLCIDCKTVEEVIKKSSVG
jgi:DnaK suppressor protein